MEGPEAAQVHPSLPADRADGRIESAVAVGECLAVNGLAPDGTAQRKAAPALHEASKPVQASGTVRRMV